MIGRRLKCRAPAARAECEHVRVVEQPVQQRGHGRGVAEEFAPVAHGAFGREDDRRAFIPAHDELEPIFGGGWWQFAHAEIVDDQQRIGQRCRGDLLA